MPEIMANFIGRNSKKHVLWQESISISPSARNGASTATSSLPHKVKRKPHTLCRELILRKDYIGNERVETIYLGGGTPSQLADKELAAIFNTIYRTYQVDGEAEITLEANPDDLRPDYIRMLRTLPFNRISIGMQTFQDKMLRRC